MEVDTTPPPHAASPAPAVATTFVASPLSLPLATRKRRRSSAEPGWGWSETEGAGPSALQQSSEQWRDGSGETHGASKKRLIKDDSHDSGLWQHADQGQHHFAAFGPCVLDDELEDNAMSLGMFERDDANLERQVLERSMSDDAVDSPMHMLRLASHSPPSPSQRDAEDEQTIPNKAQSSLHHFSAFVPRQLRGSGSPRQPQRRTSLSVGVQRDTSAPFHPSPLATIIHDDVTHSSSPSSQSAAEVERSSTIDSAPQHDSLHPARPPALRRSQTATADPGPSRVALFDSRPVPSAMSEDGGSAGSSTRSMTNGSTSSDDDVEPRGRTAWRSKPSFSPGLSSSPQFPGGKQMLRYTMGYRSDCEQCRNKVAGHYGHVVHRP